MTCLRHKPILRLLSFVLITLLIGMQGVIYNDKVVLASDIYAVQISASSEKAETATSLAFSTTIPPNTTFLKQVVLHIPEGYTITDQLPNLLGELKIHMADIQSTISIDVKNGEVTELNSLSNKYSFSVDLDRSARTLTILASAKRASNEMEVSLPTFEDTVELIVELNSGILTNPSTNGTYIWKVEGSSANGSKLTLSSPTTIITGGTDPSQGTPPSSNPGGVGVPPTVPVNSPVLTITPTSDQLKRAQLPADASTVSPSANKATELVAGDGIKINVPQGALASYTAPVKLGVGIGNITTPPQMSSGALALDPVKYQRSFTIEGASEGSVQFNSPVTLTFPFGISDLPTDLAVDKLAVYWWNPEKKDWIRLGGVVDEGNNTISVPTYHFSTYAVMVDTSSVPNRLEGADRFKTANAVANEGWKTGADSVVLVNAYSFPDALAATPLAFKYNAPILLTDAQTLTAATSTEFDKLAPKRVYIIGGKGVVSEGIENELISKYGKDNVIRYSGDNRYGTAAEVANALETTGKAVIASGHDNHFPDALAMSSFAAYKGIPILFSQKDNLPSETLKALEDQQVTTTYIAGSEGAISAEVSALLPGVNRYGGSDRYDTAIQIANGLQMNPSRIYVTTGLDFPDALVAGNLAAHSYSPLIMVDNEVPLATVEFLENKKSLISDLIEIGGTGIITEKQESNLRALLK